MRLFPQSRAAFAIPDLPGQLRWLAGATSSYAADNSDLFWSFSWKAGSLPHSDPTLPATASSDLQAAGIQAADILRRRTGRSDIEPDLGLPHALFNHLPLVDYIETLLPNFNLVAPSDRHRLNWARDPDAFDHGAFLPYQPDPAHAGSRRFPYSTSYAVPAAWWNPNNTINQNDLSQHRWSLPPDSDLEAVALTDVNWPAQKVMAHDQEQREPGPGALYCVDRSARSAILLADGSAGLKDASDSNLGWQPDSPTSLSPTRFRYEPAPWEAQSGAGAIMTGHYRWTRGGIEGRDFGGPEIDTGQL